MLVFITLLIGCNDQKQTTDQGNVNAEEAGLAVAELSDPAQLLSKAEAEVLLDEPIKEPEVEDTENAMGQILYHYDPVSEDSRSFIQISLVKNQLMSDNLKEQDYDVTKLYTETKTMLGDVQEIEGIGENAFWGTNGLYLVKGDYYLNIAVGNSSDPENLTLAQKIAEKVVERLR
jgi:hypothetical protein